MCVKCMKGRIALFEYFIFVCMYQLYKCAHIKLKYACTYHVYKSYKNIPVPCVYVPCICCNTLKRVCFVLGRNAICTAIKIYGIHECMRMYTLHTSIQNTCIYAPIEHVHHYVTNQNQEGNYFWLMCLFLAYFFSCWFMCCL
jgi:hypothetical protein